MDSHTTIVRNITDLENFSARIHQESEDVRSLSIIFEPVALIGIYGDNDDPFNASEITKHVWRLMEELGGALPLLKGLRSFSLQIRKGRNGFWIPRPLISTLLSKLPSTCTSVEVDTQGSDRAEPGTTHLCDTIRNMLPKLKHFRLDLATLCTNAWQMDAPCPKLMTLTISCFAGGSYNSRLCGSYIEDPVHSAFAQGEEAMLHLVRQLRTVADRFPRGSRAILCDESGSSNSDSAFHLTYNLRDVLKNTVTSMPVQVIHPLANDRDGNMLRTPDGDVFGSLPALKAVLEAEVREQHGEDRALPRDTEEPQPLMNFDEWKAKYPRRSCTLWANEKREGKRLVEACVVEGAASRVRLPVFPEYEGHRLRDYDASDWDDENDED